MPLGLLRRGEDLFEQRSDDHRVELLAGAAQDLVARLGLGLGRAVGPGVRHRVPRVGGEDDPRPERDALSRQLRRHAAPVPALVVVQHPRRHGLDVEREQHPVADRRVTLEHVLLAPRERARLAQDLLGHGELADVVQPAREPDQLDLLLGQAQTRGDPGGEIADPGRVTSLERVAGVDGARERRGGLEPRRPVRRPRQPPQLRDRRHVRAVDANPVLALALRPVEGDVGDANECVAVVRVIGVGGDAGGDAKRSALLPLLLAESAHELVGCGGQPRPRARVGTRRRTRHRRAGRPRRSPQLARDVSQHAVADGMAVAVVDLLEVVEVEEADRQRLPRAEASSSWICSCSWK